MNFIRYLLSQKIVTGKAITGPILLQLFGVRELTNGAQRLSISDGSHNYSITLASDDIAEDCKRNEFKKHDIFELLEYQVIRRGVDW